MRCVSHASHDGIRVFHRAGSEGTPAKRQLSLDFVERAARSNPRSRSADDFNLRDVRSPDFDCTESQIHSRVKYGVAGNADCPKIGERVIRAVSQMVNLHPLGRPMTAERAGPVVTHQYLVAQRAAYCLDRAIWIPKPRIMYSGPKLLRRRKGGNDSRPSGPPLEFCTDRLGRRFQSRVAALRLCRGRPRRSHCQSELGALRWNGRSRDQAFKRSARRLNRRNGDRQHHRD